MRPPKQRRTLLTPQGRANADINVTPLVDVVLVLLIIFMVVTPLAQAELPLALPKTAIEESGASSSSQLLVSLDAAGQLRVAGAPVPADDLTGHLRQALAQRRPGERQVFFEAADGANYATVVAALDAVRDAGAESLEVVTEAQGSVPH
ncbi:biopolymer transporter ExbD [Aggregicoccus sp. 17bor-14]|uniref:ExbD/TolR family protein n=1 Tax=Myxococcaceae TaxID=31 RepID=UPI00129C8A3E|nr:MULTISPECIES: biopolymer transporter ExbD [Myxococcaceae]MBF5041145.1 biopolymer transporter ExbD [Simulacricoccus sp. 17bor-14]MRI86932.1 biopolymer transporter ExbD [Aggregicoccus sp. 17bor-14]